MTHSCCCLFVLLARARLPVVGAGWVVDTHKAGATALSTGRVTHGAGGLGLGGGSPPILAYIFHHLLVHRVDVFSQSNIGNDSRDPELIGFHFEVVQENLVNESTVVLLLRL